jgi:hypothetical protein
MDPIEVLLFPFNSPKFDGRQVVRMKDFHDFDNFIEA